MQVKFVRLSASAARVRTLLSGLFWMILAALVAERAGYAGAYDGSATLESLVIQAALSAPAVAYLSALWQLRTLAGRVARGQTFAQQGAGALRRSGGLLMLGAALALLVLPVAVPAAAARRIELDVSTFVIGTIGLALLLLARLLDQARVVQSELDEFF